MKFKNIKLLAILPAAVYLGGCASIVDGTQQSISVTTSPVQNATCSLTNNKGTWYVNQTPGSVTVHKSYSPLNVNCSKDEYSGSETVKSTTKGMAFGNVLFGGVVGAGVDMSDGAAYDYPVTVNVPLTANS